MLDGAAFGGSEIPWATVWRTPDGYADGYADRSRETHEECALEARRPLRIPGAWKGRVKLRDDFDAPLPADIEGSFYESSG